MKTTREVFIIMRTGKIDKRDHEIAKKPTILSICKQYVIWLPDMQLHFMLKMLLKLTKDNSNFAEINETIPVKIITITWSV